jgi:predicted O-linked N-acetylglucosamine transferase (SPINDLY family)
MKLNADVIGVWAEILKRVQGSLLFLKTGKFSNKILRQHIRQQFEARGIDGERLILKSLLPRDEYLAAYNEIDIALDPFPYCGTTTTIDALSMGVPVVTLIGERWIQRTSYGFLKGMSMEFLCARTEQEYMNIAIELAGDKERLSEMKVEGRRKFIESRICDPVLFTEHLENAYRSMTQKLAR